MYRSLAELLDLPQLESDMAIVDRQLREAVASDITLLSEPSTRVIAAGGKRLRPVLVLGVASAVHGGVPADAYRAAVAVELVHVGSLVHDDLLDGAASRRGAPTVNAVEGDSRAVLIGDYILGKAGEISASISREVAAAVAWSIGALCTGQILESGELYDPDRTIESTLASIRGKTADLTATACRVAGYCAGLDEQEADVFARYGRAFGMSFQLVDDVLDITSTSALMGKPVGSDIRSGVYTVPMLLARDRLPGGEFRAALRRSVDDDEVAESCLDMVRASGAIGETLRMARDYAEESAAVLEAAFPGDRRFAGLAGLGSWYLDYTIENLIPQPVAFSVV